MEKQSYKIGDILRNPFVGYGNRKFAYFVYMGVHGNFVSVIHSDGQGFEFVRQAFYKRDVLYPENEKKRFRKVGHTQAFKVLSQEIKNLIDQEGKR